jgi:hypothetical protein
VTDQERAEVALRHYHDNVSVKDLSRIYARSASAVARLIREAFARKLVEVRAVAKVEIEFDPVLEARLRDLYPRLHGVIVVRPPKTADSDEVHELIGRGMALHVARGAVVRKEDTIALGGGRGVYHMVDALRTMPKLRAEDVLVMSLCGAVHPHHDSDDKNLRLDADANVNLLGPVFETRIKQRMISQPIGNMSSRSARADYFDGKDWGGRVPTHAFVGVGAIATKHRMDSLAKDENSLLSKAVRPLLEELIHVSEAYRHEVEPEPYYPIAEIAHHLFLVPPPPEISIRPTDRAKMEQRIVDLNNQLFVPRKEDFDRMGCMYLLAGTLGKAAAIRYLLKPPAGSPVADFPIRFLCTDHTAAIALISQAGV